MVKLPIMTGDYLHRFGPVLRRFRDMLDGTHAEIFAEANSLAILAALDETGDWLTLLEECVCGDIIALLEAIEDCVCAALRGIRARGEIHFLDPSTVTGCADYQTGDSFTLNDGVNPPVTFEFYEDDETWCLSEGVVGVPIGDDPARNLRDAINAQENLDIVARLRNNVVYLRNEHYGVVGNILILYIENVDGTYLVFGMEGGAQPTDAPALPANQVVVLADANTEYAVAIPASRGYEFRARGNVELRYAHSEGRVAAPDDPYLTLEAGEQYHVITALAAHTLYLATATAGTVVELLVYEV